MAARADREIAQVETAREDFVGLQKFVGYGQDMLLAISIPTSRNIGETWGTPSPPGHPVSYVGPPLVTFSLTVRIGP